MLTLSAAFRLEPFSTFSAFLAISRAGVLTKVGRPFCSAGVNAEALAITVARMNPDVFMVLSANSTAASTIQDRAALPILHGGCINRTTAEHSDKAAEHRGLLVGASVDRRSKIRRGPQLWREKHASAPRRSDILWARPYVVKNLRYIFCRIFLPPPPFWDPFFHLVVRERTL